MLSQNPEYGLSALKLTMTMTKVAQPHQTGLGAEGYPATC